MEALLQILRNIQLNESRDDCIQWKWSKDLNFSVKSAYSKWEDHNFGENKALFLVWRNICPPKVEMFVWLALQGCIASKSVLVSRGILNECLDICPFCNIGGETPPHILLHRQFSWEVW